MLDRARRRLILELLAEGHPQAIVAGMVGCSPATVYRIKRRPEPARRPGPAKARPAPPISRRCKRCGYALTTTTCGICRARAHKLTAEALAPADDPPLSLELGPDQADRLAAVRARISAAIAAGRVPQGRRNTRRRTIAGHP